MTGQNLWGESQQLEHIGEIEKRSGTSGECRLMFNITRRRLAGLAVWMAVGGISINSTKGAPTMADPNLIKKLDAIFGAHMEAELAGDLDKTLATMSANPHIVNVPTMVGGQGPNGVRTFYANRLIGQFFPPDVKFETISRTYSNERLVDELIHPYHRDRLDAPRHQAHGQARRSGLRGDCRNTRR